MLQDRYSPLFYGWHGYWNSDPFPGSVPHNQLHYLSSSCNRLRQTAAVIHPVLDLPIKKSNFSSYVAYPNPECINYSSRLTAITWIKEFTPNRSSHWVYPRLRGFHLILAFCFCANQVSMLCSSLKAGGCPAGMVLFSCFHFPLICGSYQKLCKQVVLFSVNIITTNWGLERHAVKNSCHAEARERTRVLILASI